MKQVTIEWMHLDKDGTTCDRCADTGKLLKKAVAALQKECRSCGTRILFKEIKLSGRQIKNSNAILFNGTPIEDVLPRLKASTNHCGSCSELVGKPTSCRTLRAGKKILESIPKSLIREALCTVLHCCE